MAKLKPYPRYKDSGVPWLVNIPAHWDLVKMKYLLSERKEKGFPGEPLLAATQTKGVILKNQYENRTVLALKDLHLLKLVERGDYVISLRSFQGGIEYAHFRGIISPAYTILKPSARVQRGFFEPFFKSAGFVSGLSLCVTGIREGQNIDYVRLSRMPMPVPPVEEQLAIGRYLRAELGKINQIIRAKRRLIELLNEQKQAIIQRAVTRGLDPNVRLKPSGIDWLGDVPVHWVSKPTKYFLREIDERSNTGTEELLSVSHITGVSPRSQKSITMFMAGSYVGHKVCRSGDLVINTMWAWMGAMGVAKQSGIVSPSYAVYRPMHADAFIPDFLDHLLRTRPFVSKYICLSTGIRSSRLRLYPEEFLKIPLIQPPLEEQVQILGAVKQESFELDQAVGRANREIDLIREYRTRLIADVVTGKLDVRNAELPALEEAEEDSAAQEGSTGDAVEPDEELETAEEHVDVAE